MKLLHFSGLVAGLLGPLGAAPAALLAVDDFEYPAGPLTANNGGAGFGGAWSATGVANNVQVENAGLSIAVLGYEASPAGASISNSTGSTYSARTFGASVPVAEGASYYFSLVFNVAAANANNRAIRLFNTGGQSNQGFGVNFSDAAGISAGINSNAGTTFDDLDYTLGSPQLLVGKVTFSDTALSDRIDVWLFNQGGDIGGTDFTSSPYFSTGDVTATNGVAVARGTTTADLYQLDSFRFGNTVNDVLTIPEPSAAACATLGLALFLRRRR
jgi:hypothetical protein